MDIKELFNSVKKLFGPYMVERAIVEVDSWNGSAGQWEDADSYCADCLIDLNSAARNDEKVKGLCYLPIRRPEDSQSDYVRQAVHAAAGGRGITRITKPADVSQDDFASAIKSAANKIKSLYGEMDEEVPEGVENLTRAMSLEGIDMKVYMASEEKYPQAWFHGTYRDSNGDMFAVLSQDGKLYRSPVNIMDDESIMLGDWFEVEQEFVPVQTRTVIRQQPNGRFRWVSRSATSVFNRVGEIDSRSLFDSFVDHIEQTGEYPIRQFYHQGEQFRTGQADFVARDGNVLITSGLYDKDNILAQKEIKAIQREPDYWGESIGYKPLDGELVRFSDNIQIPVYTRGIFKEISFLPEDHAASLFTVINNMEVNRMLKGRVKEIFDKLFEDDPKAGQEFLEGVDETNRSIDEAEMITRDSGDVEATDEESETGEAEEAQESTDDETDNDEAQEVVVTDDVIEAVVSRMQEVENAEIVKLRTALVDAVKAIDELADVVNRNEQLFAELDNRIKALEKDEESKKREYLEDVPRKNTVRTVYKPRQSANGNESPKTASEAAKELLPAAKY